MQAMPYQNTGFSGPAPNQWNTGFGQQQPPQQQQPFFSQQPLPPSMSPVVKRQETVDSYVNSFHDCYLKLALVLQDRILWLELEITSSISFS